LVLRRLLEGVSWNARLSAVSSWTSVSGSFKKEKNLPLQNSSEKVSWKPLSTPKFTSTDNNIYRGLRFADMKEGVLYKRSLDTYAAVDLLFKLEENTVVGVQVSREQKGHRQVTARAWNLWLKSLGIEDEVRKGTKKVQYWYVPQPRLASDAEVTFHKTAEAPEEPSGSPEAVWIVQVPESYSASADKK
jgi:hypothetical protein